MIIKKDVEEKLERLNAKLQALCVSNIAIDFDYPSFILMKDGSQLRGEQPDGSFVSDYESECYAYTWQEAYTALLRASMFLYGRETGAEAGASHYIKDQEILWVFGASFI